VYRKIVIPPLAAEVVLGLVDELDAEGFGKLFDLRNESTPTIRSAIQKQMVRSEK
jgi:hypothetical protein